MNNEELITSLRYLITKYIPLEKRCYFESSLSSEDIPVKGILADFNEFSQRKVEEIDGELIKKIYFYFC